MPDITTQTPEEWLLHTLRPRFGLHLGLAAGTLRQTRHWEAAFNLLYTAVVLAVTGFILRHGFHMAAFPLVVVSAAITIGSLKITRVRLDWPGDYDTEPEPNEGDTT